MADQDSFSDFDTAPPNIARVYDHLLGGKDNFASDRALVKQITATLPTVQVGVRAQREVLGRVVRHLVGEAGIRQLLDIGSGLPTVDNVHEIAQRIDPDTRVAYVDNDPVVLSHARALLASSATTIVVGGDLRAPERIIADPLVRQHLDWDQPIGLLLCGILHYIRPEEGPGELTRILCEALPSGSYVFIHHLFDSGDPQIADVQAAFYEALGRGEFRTREQIGGLFHGLELVEPGLVLVPEWRPDETTLGVDEYSVFRLALVGVARKP